MTRGLNLSRDIPEALEVDGDHLAAIRLAPDAAGRPRQDAVASALLRVAGALPLDIWTLTLGATGQGRGE